MKEQIMELRLISDNQYVLDTVLMRSNSRVGDTSWLARITGPHPKFGFEREFAQRERHQVRPTENGTQSFGPLTEGEIYEYRNIAGDGQSAHSYNRDGGHSGFFKISNGEICELEKAEVSLIVKTNGK